MLLKMFCDSSGLVQEKKATCVYTHAGNETLTSVFFSSSKGHGVG